MTTAIKDKLPTWKEFIEHQDELIKACILQYPDRYLCTVEIFLRPVKDLDAALLTIGLFMCSICSKPISHNQFAFCGNCGSCDIGNRNPKWKIEVPERVKARTKEYAEHWRLVEENKKLKNKLKEFERHG